MSRSPLEYDKVLGDLFNAIHDYRSERTSMVRCPVMTRTYRDKIFRYYEEIENMGRNKREIDNAASTESASITCDLHGGGEK